MLSYPRMFKSVAGATAETVQSIVSYLVRAPANGIAPSLAFKIGVHVPHVSVLSKVHETLVAVAVVIVHVDPANSIDVISAWAGNAVPVIVTTFVVASQVKPVISPTGAM